MSEQDEPVRLPIEDSIDLHTFTPRDIPDVVESYLKVGQSSDVDGLQVPKVLVNGGADPPSLLRSYGEAGETRIVRIGLLRSHQM